jgi:hypothetical protein
VARFARHLLAVAAFALLTAFWLWPALRAPGTMVPGDGAGDNLTFVWNTWWMRQALAAGTSPLWTAMLFAPWGTSLALNTHAAAPSLAGAVLLPVFGSAIAATNAIVAVNLLLNLLASYALGFRLTHSRAAAAVGAIVFGCSPYLGAHLQGHFNLLAAWVLPLSILVTLQVLERGSRANTLAAGLTWGTLVYVEYYYAVFAALMVLALLATRAADARVVPPAPSRWPRRLLVIITALLALDAVLLVVIAVTGGTAIRAGGSAISIRGIDNPIAAGGLLVALAAAILIGRRTRTSFARSIAVADLRQLAAPLAIAFVLSAPVLLAIGALWMNGDYVSQRYLWRSAPAGIDLATLLLGNPTGLFTQTVTQRAYSALGIDNIEQSGWLGPAVIILCGIALLTRSTRRESRLWLVIGVLFATWAIGPYIVAAGTRVWVLLPATLVRFVPLVSNARIPSRAMIVVSLSAAMLAAIAWRHLQERDRRVLASCLALLLALDYLPARPPFFSIDRPAVYDALAAQAVDGILCELPIGLRDGFGEIGSLDTRVLAYQTRHAHPLTGGFVARLSPRLLTAHQADPVLGPLLRLSAGAPMTAEPPQDRQTAGSRLFGHGIRYVIVNEQTAPPDLIRWVRANLPLRVIAADGERTLYALDAAIAGSPPRRSPVPSRP